MLFHILDDYNCMIIILTLLHYNYYFNAGERDSCFINSGVLGSSWAILGRLASSYSRLLILTVNFTCHPLVSVGEGWSVSLVPDLHGGGCDCRVLGGGLVLLAVLLWYSILLTLHSHEVSSPTLVSIVIWHEELGTPQPDGGAPVSWLVAHHAPPSHLPGLYCELVPWSYRVG